MATNSSLPKSIGKGIAICLIILGLLLAVSAYSMAQGMNRDSLVDVTASELSKSISSDDFVKINEGLTSLCSKNNNTGIMTLPLGQGMPNALIDCAELAGIDSSDILEFIA